MAGSPKRIHIFTIASRNYAINLRTYVKKRKFQLFAKKKRLMFAIALRNFVSKENLQKKTFVQKNYIIFPSPRELGSKNKNFKSLPKKRNMFAKEEIHIFAITSRNYNSKVKFQNFVAKKDINFTSVRKLLAKRKNFKCWPKYFKF